MLLFSLFGILDDKYPEYIDELNYLVSFTAFCFLLFSKYGFKKVNKSYIDINFFSSQRVFSTFSLFYFVLAFLVFLIEGKGLDFANARNNFHETLENRSFIVGYFRLLSIPLSIYAGSRVIRWLLNLEHYSPLFLITLFLPFFSDSLFSLTEGGRVAMVYGLLLYILGAALTLPLSLSFKGKWKLIFVGILFALLVNFVISYIGEVRTTADGNSEKAQPIKESLGVFSVFYGGMEYVGSTYVGYQYRRVDAVEEEYGLGQFTFNGFINWQIPFASRFGLNNASIAKALDIYYYNQETYDFSRNYFYFTHSAYLPLIKDFGFKGSFVAIFFLTFLSHYFFVKIQMNNRIQSSMKFFLFYIFFFYWARSNFYGTLSDSIMIPLYSFLIVDFVNSIFKKKY